MPNDKFMKIFSLIVLTFHLAGISLLTRYSRTRKSKDETQYLPTVAVVLAEVVKLTTCSIILIFQLKGVGAFLTATIDTVFKQPLETVKICIPSIVYLIQNNLYYVALSNLDASVYNVVFQLKVLSTALFFVALLGKRLSSVQWASIIVLMAGVALVQVQQSQTTQDANVHHNPALGFLAVLAMSLTSGFAGVYFEKVLKGSSLSLWMQNIRLALLGIPLGLIPMYFKDWEAITSDGLFQGFDWIVVLAATQNALGGLLIAVVIKYADNILKAYAQSLAIIVACIGSGILFDFTPSWLFLFGSGLVMFSIYLYAKYPPKVKQN